MGGPAGGAPQAWQRPARAEAWPGGHGTQRIAVASGSAPVSQRSQWLWPGPGTFPGSQGWQAPVLELAWAGGQASHAVWAAATCSPAPHSTQPLCSPFGT